MNTRRFLKLLGAVGALPGVDVLKTAARAAETGGTRLAARLIWGTNGNKPEGQDLKPIEADLAQKLRRIFKWQKYFGIERKEFDVTSGKLTRVDMSKECRLEIQRIGTDEFEIQLIGKGVPVVKQRKRIVPSETVVLGGDDKHDNAWFVVVGLASDKAK